MENISQNSNNAENTSEKSNNNGISRIKLTRRIISASLCMAVAALFFYCGYMIGGSGAAVTASRAKTENEPTAAPALSENTEITYEICASQGRLYLFEVSGGEKSLLAGDEISPELFPPQDQRELEEGIIFDDPDAARAAFEDFVS